VKLPPATRLRTTICGQQIACRLLPPHSGSDPTITDAYVVLGVIDPESFLGGRMRLSRELAEKAIDRLAGALGLSGIETAESVLRVATSNMYSALVPLMAQKCIDISEFSLLTYGGAGPTHGFLLAREVGISTVIVPPHPGTLCALGCLVADVKSDFIRTVNVELDPADPAAAGAPLRASYEDLAREADRWLAEEKVDVLESRVVFAADMRFHGQAFEVEVQLGDDPLDGSDFARRVLDAFYRRYQTLYNVEDLGGLLEVVNARYGRGSDADAGPHQDQRTARGRRGAAAAAHHGRIHRRRGPPHAGFSTGRPILGPPLRRPRADPAIRQHGVRSALLRRFGGRLRQSGGRVEGMIDQATTRSSGSGAP
jgi:N-methylhydantoinase A/oxoprolinase/acetone carboxylase beta subunit